MQDLFTQALGIYSPWLVKDVEFPKSLDRVMPVLQEPVNPSFKSYGWQLPQILPRVLLQNLIIKKIPVRRIGSAKLVILDAPILHKPSRTCPISD